MLYKALAFGDLLVARIPTSTKICGPPCDLMKGTVVLFLQFPDFAHRDPRYIWVLDGDEKVLVLVLDFEYVKLGL